MGIPKQTTNGKTSIHVAIKNRTGLNVKEWEKRYKDGWNGPKNASVRNITA